MAPGATLHVNVLTFLFARSRRRALSPAAAATTAGPRRDERHLAIADQLEAAYVDHPRGRVACRAAPVRPAPCARKLDVRPQMARRREHALVRRLAERSALRWATAACLFSARTRRGTQSSRLARRSRSACHCAARSAALARRRCRSPRDRDARSENATGAFRSARRARSGSCRITRKARAVERIGSPVKGRKEKDKSGCYSGRTSRPSRPAALRIRSSRLNSVSPATADRATSAEAR